MTIRLGPLLLALTALVAIIVGVGSVLNENSNEPTAAARSMFAPRQKSVDVSLLQQPPEMIADEQMAPVEDATFAALLPPDAVARMIAQTASSDAQLRADAISALGNAPKSQALPVLRDVLNNGEPSVDRPLALQALRSLALYQDDDDGAIRSAVREAMYHGDDEAITLSAQAVLEVIEESEMGPAH